MERVVVTTERGDEIPFEGHHVYAIGNASGELIVNEVDKLQKTRSLGVFSAGAWRHALRVNA